MRVADEGRGQNTGGGDNRMGRDGGRRIGRKTMHMTERKRIVINMQGA